MNNYKVGDRVKVGAKEREMEVYEEITSGGEKYLALRYYDTSLGKYTVMNGRLSYYESGFWGGIKV